MNRSIWDDHPDMPAEQRRVDAIEESAVTRYAVLFGDRLPIRIHVCCPLCGTLQSATAVRDRRWVPIVCILCGLRSIALPGDGT